MGQQLTAFREARLQTTWVFGAAQTVQIGATANIPAIVQEITSEQVFIAGGTAESGGWQCTVAKEDVSLPAKFTSIIYGGKTLKVLSVNDQGELYLITAGDPMS